MVNRKLDILPEEGFMQDGYLRGPAVLSSYDKEDEVERLYPIYALFPVMTDGGYRVAAATPDRTMEYTVKDLNEVKINRAKNQITFSAYDRIYTVRAFQDSDGVWASRLAVPVPAKSLEERFMTEADNAFSPDAPADSEDLFAAVNDETGLVEELVYAYEGGAFARSSGGWFQLPENDDSLDGMTVVPVTPKFISAFDRAESGKKSMTLAEAEKFSTDTEGA
jgi:hypothetical protein